MARTLSYQLGYQTIVLTEETARKLVSDIMYDLGEGLLERDPVAERIRANLKPVDRDTFDSALEWLKEGRNRGRNRG